MTFHRSGNHRCVRGLGIGLLILSLGHTPLPKADYHNIRHHDGPGEVCRLHEHLLRWHPGAQQADDIAVLHWHWFLPSQDRPGSADGQTAGLHAAVPDWSALTWDDAPQIAPDAPSRFCGRPDLACFEMPLPRCDAGLTLIPVRAGPGLAHTFSATFAPRAPLASLLQRWVC